MAVGDAHVFPGFLTPVLTQLFFPKPPTTFLTCFYRGERRKYTGKRVRLTRGSNSKPPGHESDMLTIEPPWRGGECHGITCCRAEALSDAICLFPFICRCYRLPIRETPLGRRLVITGDSVRIQDKTTESSAWFFNVARCIVSSRGTSVFSSERH